mmetsp:Transcript_102760/g.257717  ORF Transcript_102760/g.257717 Transcript_102760/m.257717 type:complete len:668 (-) Transcript_102760:398-2401(-)
MPKKTRIAAVLAGPGDADGACGDSSEVHSARSRRRTETRESEARALPPADRGVRSRGSSRGGGGGMARINTPDDSQGESNTRDRPRTGTARTAPSGSGKALHVAIAPPSFISCNMGSPGFENVEPDLASEVKAKESPPLGVQERLGWRPARKREKLDKLEGLSFDARPYTSGDEPGLLRQLPPADFFVRGPERKERAVRLPTDGSTSEELEGAADEVFALPSPVRNKTGKAGLSQATRQGFKVSESPAKGNSKILLQGLSFDAEPCSLDDSAERRFRFEACGARREKSTRQPVGQSLREGSGEVAQVDTALHSLIDHSSKKPETCCSSHQRFQAIENSFTSESSFSTLLERPAWNPTNKNGDMDTLERVSFDARPFTSEDDLQLLGQLPPSKEHRREQRGEEKSMRRPVDDLLRDDLVGIAATDLALPTCIGHKQKADAMQEDERPSAEFQEDHRKDHLLSNPSFELSNTVEALGVSRRGKAASCKANGLLREAALSPERARQTGHRDEALLQAMLAYTSEDSLDLLHDQVVKQMRSEAWGAGLQKKLPSASKHLWGRLRDGGEMLMVDLTPTRLRSGQVSVQPHSVRSDLTGILPNVEGSEIGKSAVSPMLPKAHGGSFFGMPKPSWFSSSARRGGEPMQVVSFSSGHDGGRDDIDEMLASSSSAK